MKLRVYIDTSVFSARLDDRGPERRLQTEEFFARLGTFDVSTSTLTSVELAQTQEAGRREKLLELLDGLTVHPVSDEAAQLADVYLARGVFGPASLSDAIHVAMAVVTGQDILVSWNFKHLVNRRNRAKVNEVNVSRGLRAVEIVAPPEL